MTFRFEKLEIWQQARKFSVEVYKITSMFPSVEKFSIIDQIRRAVVSVALNIAERSDRKSDKEFKRFLRVAIGSLDEVITGLFISLDLRYLSQREFDKLYEDAIFCQQGLML
jgi:four helix bundle protein